MDLPDHLMHASFSPPIHAEGQNPGSWVLLDNQAYFFDQENDTTAACDTIIDGKSIKVKVTFCLAKPPLVSYFCIHCPGLDPEKYGLEPSILATEERFALLRVPICHSSCVPFQECSTYFIYQASLRRSSQEPPSLRLLPNPHPLEFTDNEIGILPRHTHKGVSFVLFALQPQTQIGVYKLHRFDGVTNSWTSRVVSCLPPQPQDYSICGIDKVITIDAKKGLMGWVDLWRGILICDVLSENPVLEYVPLPTPAVRPARGLGSAIIHRDMVAVRAKGTARGTVRYFEMIPKVIEGTRRIRGWIATIWSTQSEQSWKWHEECTFDVFDVVIDKQRHIELLASPKIYDKTNPVSSLRAASPALSLDDDHLVYFMAKIDFRDDNAWIISVDMKNQSLQEVVEFSAKRTLGTCFTRLQSTIPKFLYLSSPQGLYGEMDKQQLDEDANAMIKVAKEANELLLQAGEVSEAAEGQTE